MSGSDDELVARAATGDRDALTHLLESIGPQVRARLTIAPAWQSALDVADVLQVTYLEAFLRIGELRNPSIETFAAWLARIAQNNLRDAFRQLECDNRPDRRRRIVANPEQSTCVLLDQLGVSTATASRAAVGREAVELLESAIARLPESYATVVRLHDLQGLEPQDVARQIGRSVGAVHMLRSRAHSRLRELLGASSGFFPERA